MHQHGRPFLYDSLLLDALSELGAAQDGTTSTAPASHYDSRDASKVYWTDALKLEVQRANPETLRELRTLFVCAAAAGAGTRELWELVYARMVQP